MAMLFGLLCIIIPVSATTWYVNDDGGSDYDYNSIVDALHDNEVKAGDTIYVLPGTYERFAVTKSINLQALNDKGPVIITSQGGDGVCIADQSGDDASGTIIDGFTLNNNCKNGVHTGGGDASNLIVRNCIFNGMSTGIHLESQNCTFENNTFLNTKATANSVIDFKSSSCRCRIINNKFIDVPSPWCAVYLRTGSQNAIVTGNLFENCTGGRALTLSEVSGCLVANNTFKDNTNDGIRIRKSTATDNTITGNSFTGNGGIICLQDAGNNNHIFSNTFDNNTAEVTLSGTAPTTTFWNATTPTTYTYKGAEYTGFPGNYWSGYNGTDDNNDGLIDTPYVLPGGLGTDHAPLMGAWDNGVIAGLSEPVVGPTTWYVGDGGDYTTIQEAVNAASVGDIIVVKDGAYTESVNLNKAVTVMSENGPDNVTVTTASPSEPVFEILADNVTVSSFSVRGPTNTHVAGIESVGYDDCLITGNDCAECYNGIHLGGNATNCTVTENYCHENTRRGLSLRDTACGNYVYDNYCIGNDGAEICIKDDTHDNFIWENTFIGTVECLTNNTYQSPETVTYTYNSAEHTGFAGNYYSGYTGTDANGDGIGDTPMDLGYDKYTQSHFYGEYPLMGAWENEVILTGADLAVVSFDIPSDVTTETACIVNGTIENLGETPSAPCDIVLSTKGTAIDSFTLFWVYSGETEDLSFSWTPSESGETTLTLAADPGMTVQDTDRTNNNQIVTVTVAGSGSGSDNPPVAGFETNVTSGTAPLSVLFTDTSTENPTSWSWAFGDGVTSDEQNPAHNYETTGTYTVSLNATNTDGSNTIEKTGYIVVTSGEPVEPANCIITLCPGWNFVSTPMTLIDGQNTFSIFRNVDTADHSALLYNGTRKWEAMGADDLFSPLDGIWIYANGTYEIPLTFAADEPETPPSKDLDGGWNAIGFTDTVSEPATNTLRSVEKDWTTLIGFNGETQEFDISVIRGAEGRHSEMREMSPMQGYWLFMNDANTLCAIGA